MSFYKYVKLRKGFFKDPVLRASPRHVLNDPFEAEVTDWQLGDFYKLENQWFAEQAQFSNSGTTDQCDDESYWIDETINEYGVVSFSENGDNLLMWSHYADEHRGVVIEFDSSSSWLINAEDGCDRFSPSPLDHTVEMPQLVKYQNDRYRFTLDDVVPNRYEISGKRLIDTLFFTKGLAWSYEEECRSVLRLEDADIVRLDSKLPVEVGHGCDGVTISEEGGHVVYSFLPDFEIGDPVDVNGDGVRSKLFSWGRCCAEHICLYRLNPKSIKSIYFGCRTADADIENALRDIGANSKFSSNLKVQKAVVSNDKYGLKFEDI